MKTYYAYLSLFILLFTHSACGGDDNDETDNKTPTNIDLSIEPYFKYVGLTLNEIQNYLSVPLEDNVINYYARRQWVYNQVFDAIFYFNEDNQCSTVRLQRSDDKTTNFEHFKLFTKEAFFSLGEPIYAAVYKFITIENSNKEVLFETGAPHKRGAYEETISFAEKNNVSKFGHACEMIWEKNNRKIRYVFSTQMSEVYINFNIYITK